MKQREFAVLRFANIDLDRPETQPPGFRQRSFRVFRNTRPHSPVRKKQFRITFPRERLIEPRAQASAGQDQQKIHRKEARHTNQRNSRLLQDAGKLRMGIRHHLRYGYGTPAKDRFTGSKSREKRSRRGS